MRFSYVQRNVYLIHDSHSAFHRNVYIRLMGRCHLCHTYSPTECNLYFDIPFAERKFKSSQSLDHGEIRFVLLFNIDINCNS
jgi:hypothetical protein